MANMGKTAFSQSARKIGSSSGTTTGPTPSVPARSNTPFMR